jgi:hypothetical protein
VKVWFFLSNREIPWRTPRITVSFLLRIHHITWTQPTILHSREALTQDLLLTQVPQRDAAMTGLDSAARLVSKSKPISNDLFLQNRTCLSQHMAIVKTVKLAAAFSGRAAPQLSNPQHQNLTLFLNSTTAARFKTTRAPVQSPIAPPCPTAR